MDVILKKQELLNWLQSIEDVSVLIQIEKIKDTEKGYTIEEARKLSLSKIEEWRKK
ncbi:MAG: hypothetical protein WD554_07355 [Flavobacteriaceae bacterium]